MERTSGDDHVLAARAVYDASSERYVGFVGTELSAATETPADRAVLTAFVDLVIESTTNRQVADVGCGPGRVAAFLAAQGLDAIGIDVSTAMVAAARRAHPHLEFGEGRIDDLPLGPGVLAGAVCWYSIIYTPPSGLAEAVAELRRVLEPGGHLLLAFQGGGGEGVHRSDAHGTGLALTSYRHALEAVAERLGAAEFEGRATTQRAPELEHETSPQAFVIARRL